MTAPVVRVIGIDPGPVPGIVLLDPTGVVHAVQCSHTVASVLFAALLDQQPATPTVVQIEKFVVGRRAGASSSAKAGEQTRELIGRLREVWETFDSSVNGRLGGHWFERTASQVKPWATNERLAAAGLLAKTEGMRHARDGARHAIYCAVHDAGLPDPLSKRKRSN